MDNKLKIYLAILVIFYLLISWNLFCRAVSSEYVPAEEIKIVKVRV